MPVKSFDFKRSKDLQFNLSTYIHSYYMNNDDLKYGLGGYLELCGVLGRNDEPKSTKL